MSDELQSSLKKIVLSLSELETFGVQASDIVGDISSLDSEALIVEKLHSLHNALDCLTDACRETADSVRAAIQAQVRH